MKYVLLMGWSEMDSGGMERVDLVATDAATATTEAAAKVAARDAYDAVEQALVFAVTEELHLDVQAIKDSRRKKVEEAEKAAERQRKLDEFNRLKAELNL